MPAGMNRRSPETMFPAKARNPEARRGGPDPAHAKPNRTKATSSWAAAKPAPRRTGIFRYGHPSRHEYRPSVSSLNAFLHQGGPEDPRAPGNLGDHGVPACLMARRGQYLPGPCMIADARRSFRTGTTHPELRCSGGSAGEARNRPSMSPHRGSPPLTPGLVLERPLPPGWCAEERAGRPERRALGRRRLPRAESGPGPDSERAHADAIDVLRGGAPRHPRDQRPVGLARYRAWRPALIVSPASFHRAHGQLAPATITTAASEWCGQCPVPLRNGSHRSERKTAEPDAWVGTPPGTDTPRRHATCSRTCSREGSSKTERPSRLVSPRQPPETFTHLLTRPPATGPEHAIRCLCLSGPPVRRSTSPTRMKTRSPGPDRSRFLGHAREDVAAVIPEPPLRIPASACASLVRHPPGSYHYIGSKHWVEAGRPRHP